MNSPHIGHSLTGIDFSWTGSYGTSIVTGDWTFRPLGGDAVAVLGAEERRRAPRCFSDEVAIDFPSIDEAVDRIRRGFVTADRPHPVPASLWLTRHEADAGAVRPLDVAVRCICRQCGGRGESWAEPCGTCAGSGAEYLNHQVQVSLPAGVADGACFHFTVTPRHHPPTRVELQIAVV
jgi:hypothetical protein